MNFLSVSTPLQDMNFLSVSTPLQDINFLFVSTALRDLIILKKTMQKSTQCYTEIPL